MTPGIQLDGPPRRHDTLAASFGLGCVIGLVIAGVAWWAAWPEPATAAARPVTVERRYTLVVKAPDGDRSLVCRER